MANHILAVHAAGGQVAFAVAVSTLRSLRITALGRVAATSPVLAELAAERDWDHVIGSMASEAAVHRFLEFPFHDRKRLTQAVGPALEEHVPLSLDETRVAFDSAGGKPPGRILAAMTPRTAVDEQLALLAADGLVPERLVWAPSAILEIYLRSVGTGADFVAVDLGEEAAVVGAFEGGQLTALRVVRRTDDDVFVRNVGWSLRTIERLPDRIVAGGSRASDVVGTLAESLAGLSVEHLPFDPPVELEPAAAPGWRGLAAPLGLVLASTGKLSAPTIEFPITPTDEGAAPDLSDAGRRLAPWAAAAAVLGLTAIGLDQAHLAAQAGRLQRRADSVYESVMPGQAGGPGQRVKMELRLSELENRRAQDAGADQHTSPLTILTTMSSVVPPDLEVEFESYNYDPPNVRLRGEGAAFEVVTRLQQVLDAEAGFSDVSVSDVRTAADGVGVVFELRFRVGGGPSERVKQIMMPFLRQIWQTVAASLTRLNPRERRLVMIFGAVALTAAVYVFVVEPFLDSRTRTHRRIENLASDIGEMQTLAARIRALEAASLDAQGGDSTVLDGFSLFSFVDKATSASVSRDAVASMNPAKRPVRRGFEESTVELRLTAVSLPEIVDLLEKIEAATQPVYVKRVELKRRYDDNSRFDAIIVAGAVTKT